MRAGQSAGLRSLPFILLLLAMAGYALVFSYLTLIRYAAFQARALDMGNLNQAIWNTAFGNWFHFTNQPGAVNRLSLHVEPIIVPIAGLYRLYMAFLPPEAQTAGGPPFLVVLQSVVVALGAWPLYALARDRLASAWAGLAFGLAFLLNPSIQAANWLEFHPVTLAPTFLLAAFYFLVTRRIGWFALCAVLAASCKEEIGLLVFMLGCYALVVLGRPRGHAAAAPGDAARMRRVGLATMALAMGWSLFAVLGIQHFFADGNIHWGRYGYLGDSPLQKVWSLLTRPQVVWAQLADAGALRYVHELLAPVAYLPVFAPHVFLLALPSLGINLLADFPPMHQVYTLIYAAPIMPFAMLAAVMGAARLQRWIAGAPLPPDVRRFTPGALGLAVLAAALVQHGGHGYLPGGGNYRLYTVTDHHRRAAYILAQIPPQVSVSAQDKLNPHVSGRRTVYIFPRVDDPREGPVERIWVDVTGPAWPQHPSDLHATVQELLAGEYGVAAAKDGYLLLAWGEEEKTLPPAFYSAWRIPPPASPTLAQPIVFGDRLRLVDFAVFNDAHDEVVTRLDWQIDAPLDENLAFYVAYRDGQGNTIYDTEFYPPVAQLWYPTAMWSPGATVRITTLPWTVDISFGLYVGVYRPRESGDGLGEFLPIDPTGIDLPRLENDTLVRLSGFAPGPRGEWLVPASPPDAHQPLDAIFDGQIALRGVDASVQGDDLRLTLHWEALAPVREDYTVFIHVLGDGEARVGQVDDTPRDHVGPRPMTGWRPGEPIVDSRRLRLEPGATDPTALRVQIGVYFWQDGARLPVVGADARPGDIVEVIVGASTER